MSVPCPIFGFVVRARLVDGSADALRASLVEVLEANGLEIAGSSRDLEYVISREGSQATHADRELIIDWARACTSVARVDVSDLIDLAGTLETLEPP